MQVLHSQQVIFVHIPKTAGTTIDAALKAQVKPGPWHPGFWSARREKRRLKKAGLRRHAKAIEFQAALGKARFEAYFSFAFVRNPWDLMVSSYSWWQQKARGYMRLERAAEQVSAMRFDEYLASDYGRTMINQYRGDMVDWIYHPQMHEPIQLVSYVGRFETLADDWKEICSLAGLRHEPLGSSNATVRDDYRSYYTDDTAELVQRRFAWEIEAYAYSF